MTGPGLTDTMDVDGLLGAIGVLTEAPTPRGDERQTAYALAEWAGRRWPALSFTVDEMGSGGANLVCCVRAPSRDDLLVYSHLDTSLTGIGSADHDVTGSWADAPVGFTRRGDAVSAFGLGVARGPAAAALIGFVRAATALPSSAPRSLRLVLAGGGTHENTLGEHPGPAGEAYSGLERHLEVYPSPGAALVAKCGPPGVLWEEPGAGYLRIRVSGRRGAVLSRDRARPPGGLPVHIGAMCAAFEDWRHRLTRSAHREGQIGREAGIGAVRTGSVRKPDLLPAHVDLYVYLITLPGDVVADLAADLCSAMARAFAGGPLAGCTVAVELTTPQAAGVTPHDSVFVNTAREVWQSHHGRCAPEVTGWTGSTDGALLRATGVETVRTGPVSVADDNDADRDVLRVSELMRFAHIYADIGGRWAAGEKR